MSGTEGRPVADDRAREVVLTEDEREALAAALPDIRPRVLDFMVYPAVERILAQRAAADPGIEAADAWDEGWRVGASGRTMRNPYRAALGDQP